MAKKSRTKKGFARWQRPEECRTPEDFEDLRRNPSIIRPLYTDGERDGEEFFGGGSWDE